MDMDKYILSRFIEAQKLAYPMALEELREGHKRSHWMWYIFPQLKHLGRSGNAKFYGISDADEARAYLNHPVLGQRLREVSEAILRLDSNNSVEIFGRTDSMKLRSCMTLFDSVQPADIFARVLDKYFNSRRDHLTNNYLKNTPPLN